MKTFFIILVFIVIFVSVLFLFVPVVSSELYKSYELHNNMKTQYELTNRERFKS